MRLLLLVLIILSGGCMTKYTIEKINSDGTGITVTVQSYREFEQPQVHYNRTSDQVIFDFGAESATTAQSPVEQAVGDVLRAGGTIATSGVLKPEDGE
jgi:hypothetical protein